MGDFLPQLLAKIKAAGLPMAEDDLFKLYMILSDHVKAFDYPNAIAKSLAPLLMPVLDPLVKSEIDKIAPDHAVGS